MTLRILLATLMKVSLFNLVLVLKTYISYNVIAMDLEGEGEPEVVSDLIDDVNELIQDGVDLDDLPHLIQDTRRCRSGKFNKYWNVIDNIIHEFSVPDERRQGDTAYRAPDWISLNDLRKIAEKKIETDYPGELIQIPSEEYLR